MEEGAFGRYVVVLYVIYVAVASCGSSKRLTNKTDEMGDRELLKSMKMR